jgi:predicted nuclease with TOPRIM domain
MVTIEQVKQLESRVAKAIEYVNKVTDENTLLKGKLDAYQKRIDELEVLIQRFKEDQNRIEEGIVSALERLNQFEDDVEKTLSPDKLPAKVKPVKAAPLPEKSPESAVLDAGAAKDVPEVDSTAEIADTESQAADGNDQGASELDIF